MDFRCSQPGCSLKAFWECTCNKYFCDSHILVHAREAKCQHELIEDKYRPIIEKNIEAKNVLREVRATLIKVAEKNIIEVNKCLIESSSLAEEIKVAEKKILEVNKCLIESLLFIEEKETNCENYALSNNIKVIQETINWAEALYLQFREEAALSLSAVQLLSIKNEEENKKIRNYLILNGKFKEMDINSKINFMVQNDYQNAKSGFAFNRNIKVKLISLTNDGQYIFVYCNSY
ncbi:hypothetical protein SteCoe_39783 [Stentor coeruleus]|uniref:Uncharacterized protein n=1 Tax=Stentor coeruleus TaxID=5963 RepID=A0A1R2AKK9_9CILI|nr:hypothetical protein SteCoe_39783 [Stentor coeruleus]